MTPGMGTSVQSDAKNLLCYDLPNKPSRRGYIDVRVNQLRDPSIYQEDDKTYLLYSVAGESGIAIAEINFDSP